MTIPSDFPWRPGTHGIDTAGKGFRVHMLHHSGGAIVADDRAVVSLLPVSAEFLALAKPDASDGATVGALAQAVRQAWGDALAFTVPGWTWRVRCQGMAPGAAQVDFSGPDEFSAWLAAWAARPTVRR